MRQVNPQPIDGDVAQLGEQQLCKLWVEGSSPFISTILARLLKAVWPKCIH